MEKEIKTLEGIKVNAIRELKYVLSLLEDENTSSDLELGRLSICGRSIIVIGERIEKLLRQIPYDSEKSWYAYTKIAKNQEDANGWMNKFEIIRTGHIPKQVDEACPFGGTHIHIFVTENDGDDVIVCPSCFKHANWEQRIQ